MEPCIPGYYRLGSVGHDTQMCLWDITDDILHHVTLVSPLPVISKQNGVMNNVKHNVNANNVQKQTQDPMRLIGTTACPRFDQCPRLEPLICKKIAHDRLTALIFREDCFVAACQNGYVYTWARPGTIVSVESSTNCLNLKINTLIYLYKMFSFFRQASMHIWFQIQIPSCHH
jgi:hypothetical protein